MIGLQNSFTLDTDRYQAGRERLFLSLLVLLGCAGNRGWAESLPGTAAVTPVMRQSAHGPIDVTTRVDRTSVRVADKITMTVVVRSPDGVHVVFPQPSDRLGEFDVVSVDDVLDIPVSAGRESTRTYKLESLVSGELTIPTVVVSYSDSRRGANEQGAAHTEPIAVSISSLLEGQRDPTKYRDIKGLVEVTPPSNVQSRSFIAVAVVATMLTAAATAYLMLRRRSRGISPRVWALREIQDLETLGDSGEINAVDLYTGVADIVRCYVEQQLGIDAPRLTTREFVNRITSHDSLTGDQTRFLSDFLTTADALKFAGLSQDASDTNDAILRAKQLIRESSEAGGDVDQEIVAREMA